eukprot:GFUD01035757.1.p1 GENE.GFUD01035757.1~~GFUD01035757.1.p1  ORF type:complete len:1072 (-),score=401.60 GFUD01035757.1:161-3376(-)
MKRKDPPTAQASPAKAPKHRVEVEELEEESRFWERRAGMILEVKLRNFMCHELYHFIPNQRLTFLSGENGSGKSAVLTAIVFALGGSARTSNRGSSNKGFIRTGQNSAVVEIKLLNVGESSYKPDLYGESITVRRTVTQSSSTYKILDHMGKVVVEKKVREELDRILMSFNIQVDNPIAVLNQDTAKTFLFKCEPDKLYTFFMRATQLESCKNDYNAAAVEKVQSETFLTEKTKSLPELKRELEKWEKKYQFHMNLNTRRGDVKAKKGELSWAVVRDWEGELEEERKKVEVENRKLPLCERNIEKNGDEEKNMRERKKEVEGEIQSIAKNQEGEETKLRELKQEFTAKNEIAKASRKAVNVLKRNQETIEKEKTALSEEIERLRATGTAEYEEKHRVRVEQIRKTEEMVAALGAQSETSSNHLNHLQANSRETEVRVMQLKADKQREWGKAMKTQQELEALKKGGKNKLAAFGPWMPKVVTEINKNKKFRSPPIGPLGAHINVKEGTSENIAKAIEGELGGLMHSFLVSCSQDQKELFNLFSKLGLPQKPSIFTCPFTESRHDIQAKRVDTDMFPVLIDYVDIEDSNVFNRVVDSGSLERILFIPTTGEAESVLSKPELIPTNTLHATVANSYQYYPAPNYRSYYKEDRSRGLLKANIEELVEQYKQQLAQEELQEREVEKLIKQANEERMNHMKQIDAEERKLKLVRDKIRVKNNEILNLKNEEENEAPPDISALEDDLDSRKESLDVVVTKLDEENVKCITTTETAQAAKNAFTEADQSNAARREGVEPLSGELEQLENGIKKAKRDKEHYMTKRDEYKEKITKYEKEVEEKEERLGELVEKAKYWSEERIQSRKKVDSLKREVVKMEESLKQQEETQEPRELVTQKFDSLSKVYERARAQVKYMDETVTFLESMLLQRKHGFKIIRNTTSKNINRNFTTQLNARKYIGKLEFDHHAHTLTIIVNPDSKAAAAALDLKRDIRSLSGGEKSYSSVSLILALWNAMTPPFRVLDEFDVFMDAVNRRVSLDNIINYASDDRKFQFIFLTPLNTDNIGISNDLKIIKLYKRAS